MADINLVMSACLKYIHVCWVLRIDVLGNCSEYETCLTGKPISGCSVCYYCHNHCITNYFKFLCNLNASVI